MRAAASLDPIGVVRDVNDAVEGYTKPLSHELGEAGLVPLPRIHRAHHQFDVAFRQHGDLSAFARRARSDLDIVGDADATIFAAAPRLGTPGRKACPIG